MAEDLKIWTLIIRSVIISSKDPLTSHEINRDVKMLEGKDIPYKQLNFNTLEEMLQSIPDLMLLKKNDQTYVKIVPNEKTNHIAKMVCLQKRNIKKKKTFVQQYKSSYNYSYNDDYDYEIEPRVSTYDCNDQSMESSESSSKNSDFSNENNTKSWLESYQQMNNNCTDNYETIEPIDNSYYDPSSQQLYSSNYSYWPIVYENEQQTDYQQLDPSVKNFFDTVQNMPNPTELIMAMVYANLMNPYTQIEFIRNILYMFSKNFL